MLDEKMIKETFGAMHASPDTIVEVLRVKNNRKVFSRRRVVLTAAVIVLALCLTVTVAAQGAFVWKAAPDTVLGAAYGESDNPVKEGRTEFDEYGQMINYPGWERAELDEAAAEKYVAPYVGALEQSVSMGEYILTAEAYIFDSNIRGGIIYYRLENSNGITGYYLQENGELCWDGESRIICYAEDSAREYLDTARSTDKRLCVVSCFTLADGENSADLVIYDRQGQKYEEKRMELELFDGGGMTAASDSDGLLCASPIGMRVELNALGERYSMDTPGRIELEFDDGSLYLLYDEDTLLMNYMCAVVDKSNTLTLLFNRVIDPEELAAVTIDGTKYEMAVKVK